MSKLQAGRPRMTSQPPVDEGDVVRLRDVLKIYGNETVGVTALDQISLAFQPGTFTAVMGPSGSGKSTLLHCAAGLDKPTSGSVLLDGR